MVTPDRISLTGLQVRATHGVYPEEKLTPQLFVVDLDCALKPRLGADDLDTTVDYAELAARVARTVGEGSVDLIETLAERIAATCLADERIERVEVTVHKPEAAMPVLVADVAVTIVRGR